MFETNGRMSANKPRGRWPKGSGTRPAGDAQQMGWRGPAGMGRLAGRPCKAAGRWAPKHHNRGERCPLTVLNRSDPSERALQPVVAPEQLAIAGDEARGAEDAVRLRRLCFLAQPH